FFEIIREYISGGQDSSGGLVMGPNAKHFLTIVQPKIKIKEINLQRSEN
ncbi:7189_t:CDS:2, partial [Gigaspora rosea]